MIVNYEKRVFIVDDDGSVRRALCRLLCSVGYQAEAFETAQSFLDNADLADRPACVVLDLQLPDLSGLEVQRRLNMKFPVIFITGHGEVDASVDAMKAGALDFMTKPIIEEVLLEAIDRALHRAMEDYERRREQANIQSRMGKSNSKRTRGNDSCRRRTFKQTGGGQPRDCRGDDQDTSPASDEEDAGGITG